MKNKKKKERKSPADKTLEQLIKSVEQYELHPHLATKVKIRRLLSSFRYVKCFNAAESDIIEGAAISFNPEVFPEYMTPVRQHRYTLFLEINLDGTAKLSKPNYAGGKRTIQSRVLVNNLEGDARKIFSLVGLLMKHHGTDELKNQSAAKPFLLGRGGEEERVREWEQ